MLLDILPASPLTKMGACHMLCFLPHGVHKALLMTTAARMLSPWPAEKYPVISTAQPLT